MSLLLHVCCAPCLIYPEQVLAGKGLTFSTYFYNPNIHPYKEFKKRLNTVIDYTQQRNIDLLVDRDYGLRAFLQTVVFKEDSRCPLCYAMRLEKTLEMARTREFSSFSTTLLYSKYQNHEQIKALGNRLSNNSTVLFHYDDFRGGWQKGIDRSRSLGLYRQSYCGCIYSEQERYDNRLKKKRLKEKKRNV